VKNLPVVRALMRAALRPLKSLKTSSTVRGLYVRESIGPSGGPPPLKPKSEE